MSTVAIIGGADLGQQIAAVARAQGEFQVAGFFDDFQDVGAETKGGPILGKINDVERQYREGRFDTLLIGIGYKHAGFRRACFEQFSGSIPFPTLVHPAAHIEPGVSLGPGTVVGAACVLDSGVRIGENCYFNPACVVAHDTTIGPHCFLGPGVTLAGFVTVHDGCFLGVGTTVIDNIEIAANAQTGGGTLVCADLTEAALYVGNPARKLRGR